MRKNKPEVGQTSFMPEQNFPKVADLNIQTTVFKPNEDPRARPWLDNTPSLGEQLNAVQRDLAQQRAGIKR